MLIIKHRINTSDELLKVPSHFGVEIDVRSSSDRLILSHEPFDGGEDFENWLKFWNHELLLINIKEEGLESSIIKLIENSDIKKYFFLDQSFPFLVKYSRDGSLVQALRVSEYESIEKSKTLNIEWLWLDSFTGDWSYLIVLKRIINDRNYKLCLVSPELHGRKDSNEIFEIKSLLNELNLELDAVCTKNENYWHE